MANVTMPTVNWQEFFSGSSSNICEMSLVVHHSDEPQSSETYLQSTAQSPETSPQSMATVTPVASPEQGGAPYLKIVEQPIEQFRFRYLSEMMGAHGCVGGRSGSRYGRKKCFPQVELCNFRGEAVIRCSLYTAQPDESKRTVHAHRLVKKDKNGEEDDPHDIVVNEGNKYTATFAGMGIIHTSKQNRLPEIIAKLKRQSREAGIRLSTKKLLMIQEQATKVDKQMQLNLCTLRFEAFTRNQDGTRHIICDPVFSLPIKNIKSVATGELKICRLNKVVGFCSGGDEIFMLVEKVSRKDIKVRFFEVDEDGKEIWCDYGMFGELDVHHQTAIVFRTPSYYTMDIEGARDVFIQLYRPSDNSFSEPVSFRYIPGPIKDRCRKRRRLSGERSPVQVQVMNYSKVTPCVLLEYSHDKTNSNPPFKPSAHSWLPNDHDCQSNTSSLSENLANSPAETWHGLFVPNGYPEFETNTSSPSENLVGSPSENLVGSPSETSVSSVMPNSHEFETITSSSSKNLVHHVSETSVSSSMLNSLPPTNLETLPSETLVRSMMIRANTSSPSTNLVKSLPEPLVPSLVPNGHNPTLLSDMLDGLPSETESILENWAGSDQDAMNVSQLVTDHIEPQMVQTDALIDPQSDPVLSVSNIQMPEQISYNNREDFRNFFQQLPEEYFEMVDDFLDSDGPGATEQADTVGKTVLLPSSNPVIGKTARTISLDEETSKFENVTPEDTEGTSGRLVSEPVQPEPFDEIKDKVWTTFDNWKAEDGDSPLHVAILNNQKYLLQQILIVLRIADEPRLVNICNFNLQTPLHLAVRLNQPDTVRALLKLGANPNMVDDEGNTPLHIAAWYSHDTCQTHLLDRKICAYKLQLHKKNYDGCSALHLAVVSKSLKNVKKLVRAGADLYDAELKCGRTALHFAVQEGNLDIVQFLLKQADIDINQTDYAGITALHLAHAIDYKIDPAIVELLLDSVVEPCGESCSLPCGSMTSNLGEQLLKREKVMVKQEIREPDDREEKLRQFLVNDGSKQQENNLFNGNTLDRLCKQLDASGGWEDLACNLEYGNLVEQIRSAKSPTRVLLAFTSLEQSATVEDIQRILIELNEHEAVEIIFSQDLSPTQWTSSCVIV